MSTFKNTVTINRPVKEVFAFLADMNNHEQLMAGDSIQNWSSTTEEASFTIQNSIKLSLKIDARLPDTEIVIVPASKPPFELGLNWALSPRGNYTDAVFTITADLNMMMKMLVSGPLKKLAADETAALSRILG